MGSPIGKNEPVTKSVIKGVCMMSKFVLGVMSALVVISAADAINAEIPNDLWYYIDTYMPF